MEVKKLHTPEGSPPPDRTLGVANHAAHILLCLRDFLSAQQLCDYTIIADGQRFIAHRNMLAAMSDYFRAMLNGSMIEARQDFVELKGVTANAVKVLLDFIYSGQLTLNLETVAEILVGACHLQVKQAIELCAQFLTSEMGCQSCVDILNLADAYSLNAVKILALDYVQNNFEVVSGNEQFYKLCPEHFVKILQSNDLQCPSELVLFNHVCRWVEQDSEYRTQFALELLSHVRFPLMKPEQLVDHVAKKDIMLMNADCRALLDEALHYQVLPRRHPLMQSLRTEVRNTPCLVGFGGRFGLKVGYEYNSCGMYALYDGSWKKLPDTEQSFLYAAVAVSDNFLYVCGGMGKTGLATSACHRFDPRSMTWVRIANMSLSRQSFSLLGYGGKLYAFGGGTPVEGNGPSQTHTHPSTERSEAYSIQEDVWESMPPLPDRRKSLSACQFGPRIFLSGGHDDKQTVSTFWRFDPEKGSWKNKSPMLAPHAGHAMFTVKDRIYVIDRTDLQIESYNPKVDQWVQIAVSMSPISGLARPAHMGSWVYFISYINPNPRQSYLCRRYNVVTLEAEDLPPFPGEAHCVIGTVLTLPREVLLQNASEDDETLQQTEIT